MDGVWEPHFTSTRMGPDKEPGTWRGILLRASCLRANPKTQPSSVDFFYGGLFIWEFPLYTTADNIPEQCATPEEHRKQNAHNTAF